MLVYISDDIYSYFSPYRRTLFFLLYYMFNNNDVSSVLVCYLDLT
jgi:hypothetical protein